MKPKLLLCLALALGGVFLVSDSNASIVYPKAPDRGEQIVAKYRDADEFKPFNFRFEGATIARPFGIYIYEGSLTNLLSGQLFAWTKQAAWRYLLMQGTNCIGGIDLNANEKRGRLLKFNEAFCPPKSGFNNTTLDALRVAEKFPRVQKQYYEFRYLDMEPDNFFAVWLHGKMDDILIPLPPTYGRMNAYQAYSEGQITAILGPEARSDAVMWAKLDSQRQHDNNTYVKAMEDYEKEHGGNGGAITLYEMANFKTVAPSVWVCDLTGTSNKGGILTYRARVTFTDSFHTAVKRVEILEKLAVKSL